MATSPKTATATSLLELLSKATEDDLVEIRKQISEAQRHLDSLHQVEKLMVIRVHGKPEKTPWGAKKKAAGDAPVKAALDGAKGAITRTYRTKAAEYLLHAGGTVRMQALAEQCGIPLGSASSVFDHPWFEKAGDGVRLTPEGRKLAG